MPVMSPDIVPQRATTDARRSRPSRPQVRFEKGDVVEVLPWDELIHTLDASGAVDGLPFMPEMLNYCGKRLIITKRLERTCEDIEGGMRRIHNVVFLNDLRCDGTEHGGCQKGCCMLWKDDWIRKPSSTTEPQQEVHGAPAYPFPYSFGDGNYLCQSTELLRATSDLSPFDIGSYLRDVRAKTYSARGMVKILFFAIKHRIRSRLKKKSHRFLEGSCLKTPSQNLNLQPGDWVRVKTPEAIAQTLNKEGKNRGLAFTVEMLPFCGRTFRVLTRLEKMMNESTRRLIPVEDTVILEGVTCDGCHILRGGCPKNNFHFWREIWLERVKHV
jgi:hypothetical protein